MFYCLWGYVIFLDGRPGILICLPMFNGGYGPKFSFTIAKWHPLLSNLNSLWGCLNAIEELSNNTEYNSAVFLVGYTLVFPERKARPLFSRRHHPTTEQPKYRLECCRGHRTPDVSCGLRPSAPTRPEQDFIDRALPHQHNSVSSFPLFLSSFRRSHPNHNSSPPRNPTTSDPLTHWIAWSYFSGEGTSGSLFLHRSMAHSWIWTNKTFLKE